ncbi:response regulator transcription factor [Lysinibacillus pakistanensis]|uniref:Response regulator n=1 Tax=Lysinibacillus pakistanensis TaxID=759811 RepID=A0ABX6D4C0_9BACI|nr:response regulator [Lysinibacillus pakistanensis]
MKIFIIEDDPIIRKELFNFLEKYGYECMSGDDFTNIVEDALQSMPHLIILDLNLPYQDGFQVCREIRKSSSVPIIIVTSRDTSFDELLSLQIGADDFITKPYDLQILLAHIQAVLKRTYEISKSVILTYKDLTLEVLKSKAIYNGTEIELTKNELCILRLLMLNKGNVVSRDEIMNDLWQNGDFVDENTLNVNISRLRRKLESIGLKKYLLTKRGQGYQL